VRRVRTLFAFVGGSGHLNPLVPFAEAAAAAGHTVAVACVTGLHRRVADLGLTPLATVTAGHEPPERSPLLALDPEREDRGVRDLFADRIARDQAAAMGRIIAEWRPDVVVCDEMDFGSVVAAEQAGVPCARVLVIAAGALARPELIGPPLQRVRADFGLPPDPALTMLDGALVLSPFPPSFRDPAHPLPASAHSLRWVDPPAPGDLELRKTRALVYFTLGTVFNVESGDLLGRVLAGLRDLDADVVMTVGPHIDPAEFGPPPPHVRIERYVPQGLLLPHCDLVVSHGGSGSVMGALRHGVPMVLLPLGADQPHNAARVAALGLGEVLDAVSVTPGQVRTTARSVLGTASYRTAARRVRDEIAALPHPREAVSLLEKLPQ
jgi:UDP:flavonoid glycosyltransferase YjiC (YdhE family)